MEARKSRRGPKPRNVTDPICIAIRKLREGMGETQQSFAYHMKTAVRTVARWETVRPPKAFDTLSALATLAAKNDRNDLARTILSPTASIIVDVIKGSTGLFSGLLRGPELGSLFGEVSDESSQGSKTGNAEIRERVTQWLSELTVQIKRLRLWKEAITDAEQMIDGPRRLEVCKALDQFSEQISANKHDLLDQFSEQIAAIKHDLDVASEATEKPSEPGRIEAPEEPK